MPDLIVKQEVADVDLKAYMNTEGVYFTQRNRLRCPLCASPLCFDDVIEGGFVNFRAGGKIGGIDHATGTQTYSISDPPTKPLNDISSIAINFICAGEGHRFGLHIHEFADNQEAGFTFTHYPEEPELEETEQL